MTVLSTGALLVKPVPVECSAEDVLAAMKESLGELGATALAATLDRPSCIVEFPSQDHARAALASLRSQLWIGDVGARVVLHSVPQPPAALIVRPVPAGKSADDVLACMRDSLGSQFAVSAAISASLESAVCTVLFPSDADATAALQQLNSQLWFDDVGMRVSRPTHQIAARAVPKTTQSHPPPSAAAAAAAAAALSPAPTSVPQPAPSAAPAPHHAFAPPAASSNPQLQANPFATPVVASHNPFATPDASQNPFATLVASNNPFATPIASSTAAPVATQSSYMPMPAPFDSFAHHATHPHGAGYSAGQQDYRSTGVAGQVPESFGLVAPLASFAS
ncbi:hypothetical protein CAOG_01843 [Capsaspora owczarzaki ATCC 30864]|uniref:Uncharacterized protein n=1 Tax=Capsaspora owczarzaki (strain ATCC 30864) TaxID=595528 RepID=A0A0D2WK38_CAPO3|nr:hypothetical protein CAOG_01843 [Capsaspora owczarzaki ATCC 30864]KJE90540.1 hypothetical protein CAOG_001843 [Capsaspora owczarzaki ATCC 30864]|eukprot:XP_004364711.1 hypothetical protein CAOG_01843 [Capsaspora owczarzaki ATCC 30864]